MTDNGFAPWEPKLNWDTPCGKSLKKLINIFRTTCREEIGIFLTAGSWFQMVVDPTEKTKDVDVIICKQPTPGDLVPVEDREIHSALEAEGLAYKIENRQLYKSAKGVLPYIDVLNPHCMLMSAESTGRASCSYFDNVALCVFHPADWIAMHTPSELQARDRVERTIKTLKCPTAREYIRAVEDIGHKGIILHPRFGDPIPVAISGRETKEVLSQIKSEAKLSRKSVDFGI